MCIGYLIKLQLNLLYKDVHMYYVIMLICKENEWCIDWYFKLKTGEDQIILQLYILPRADFSSLDLYNNIKMFSEKSSQAKFVYLKIVVHGTIQNIF